MKINYDVPFYGNTPDNTHCFQASLKMILKYFYPNKDYSWKKLDAMTGKELNKWTWALTGINWMATHGLKVKYIYSFDYNKFSVAGSTYISEFFNETVAEEQEKNSNIPKEMENAKKLIELIDIDPREPVLDDILNFLSRGYIIQTAINSKVLKKEEGYSGHSVVIIGCDEENLLIHNPGLPPSEKAVVSFELFEKSWAYPNNKAKNLLAIKR